MSVVLVTESDADPTLSRLQCKLYKQLLSPSNAPDASNTHLKSTVFKGHHLRVKENLIPREQEHRAAAAGRQQQQRADRRQQQRQQLQTPSNAVTRSGGRRGASNALAGVAVRLLWHALNSLCQRTPTRSPDTHWELLSR